MAHGSGIKRRILAVSLMILLLFSILSILIVRNAGTYLLVSDPLPQKLDLVFTFAGENSRPVYSQELLKKYSCAHWLMSDYKKGYIRILRRDKYDMSRVSVIDTCKNTNSEVTAMLEWIGKNLELQSQKSGINIKVGLVSGPYHMRRIKMMVEYKLKEQNIDFYYLPVPMDRYKWTNEMFRNWWNSPVYNVVSSELIKIAYFQLVNKFLH